MLFLLSLTCVGFLLTTAITHALTMLAYIDFVYLCMMRDLYCMMSLINVYVYVFLRQVMEIHYRTKTTHHRTLLNPVVLSVGYVPRSMWHHQNI